MQRQSFTTPTDRLMPSQLANNDVRSHTTCTPFFLYPFLLFIVEVMLYDMEQPFGQFPAMSLSISCLLLRGSEQEKERLDPGRVVQQQTKQQHVINMGLDFNLTHSPIGDAMKKVNSISSRPITERKPQEVS